MTRRKKVWISGFLEGAAFCVILGSAAYYMRYQEFPWSDESVVTGPSAQKAVAIEKLIDEVYLEEVDPQNLEDGMYAGMMASLGDPYSGYYTAEVYQSLQESTEGEYTGIGLTMQQDTQTKEITVVDCYPGGPAEQAGVQKGDVIYEVNGQLASEMTVSELAEKIRGGELEEILLTLKREGEETPLQVRIVPGTVVVPAVSSRMLDASVGYIRISSFTEKTSGQFEAAREALGDQGMTGLIVDLRNNPGGLLESVCDTLRQILPEGLIVYTEDKYGEREEYRCSGETPITTPLVVLVNGESASASEIFAGAVKDHGVGKILGETTFGKGIVQKTFQLPDGSAVKMTSSRYYTPNGVNIHGTGIEPDVTVEWNGEEPLADSELSDFFELDLEEWEEKDAQLRAAVEEVLTQEKALRDGA